MGSVADSVAAKIRIIIDNTNFLVRKITQKWISLIYLCLIMLNQTLKSYITAKQSGFQGKNKVHNNRLWDGILHLLVEFAFFVFMKDDAYI